MNNIIVKHKKDHSKYYRYHSKLPKYSNYLKPWGEMVVVKQNKKMKKLTPKGRVAMFIGYPDDCSPLMYCPIIFPFDETYVA